MPFDRESGGKALLKYMNLYNLIFHDTPTSASSQRNKLYIVKIGDFDEKGNDILEDTKLYLNAFYQIEVKELPSIKLDKIPQQYKRSNTYGPQLKTSYIIDTLLTRILPDSAFAVIAFTPYDLFPAEDWNFVFGMASREKRVGVWSLARLGDYNKDAQLFNRALMRTLKIAAHETGHLFGIKHCVINECCMKGGNSLSESDDQPLWFCWECTAKICWNRNILPLTQLQALQRFHQYVTKDTVQIAYYNQAIALLDR